MALLGDFLSSDPAGEGPRSLVLSGEPGTGKTALLNHAYTIGDRAVFRIGAQEALPNVALATAGELLRDLGNVDAEDDIFSQMPTAEDPWRGN